MLTPKDATKPARAVEISARSNVMPKAQSLGLVAGGIAHDLGNILTVLLGKANMALEQLDHGSPARPLVEGVVEVGDIAAALGRQLLLYASEGEPLVEELDLNGVLREMSSLLDGSVPERVQIVHELSESLPALVGIKTQLQQIALNLVKNGAEAIEAAGIVRLSTASVEIDAAHFDGVGIDLPAGRYLTLEISDDGAGMNELTKTRLFDPFFTTKATGQGLGLGAVHGAVATLGGGILVTSELGVGTTFEIFLPAIDREPSREIRVVPRAPRGAPARAEEPAHGTILIVDDQDLVRIVTAHALQQEGYATLSAEDGAKALELFRAHEAEIACVVLDLNMPHFGGEFLIGELQALGSAAQVILFSACGEDEISRRFGQEKIAAHIQKPCDFKTLKRVVREVLSDTMAQTCHGSGPPPGTER